MIRSQDVVSQVASRIERAFRRKYPHWVSIGMTPGAWESAASRLLEASKVVPGSPIDPELFVFVQVRARISPDPWSELTQSHSLARYLKALKRIISQLRKELRSEMRRAECRLLRGATLDHVLATEGRRLSPLTRYILAQRAGRDDLSSIHRASAENQDRSCPLYRMASRSLLPEHLYPSTELAAARHPRPLEVSAFSLN